MASTFLFAVTAPNGTVHACFELQDNHHYLPQEVTVLPGLPPGSNVESLIVTMTHLPDEGAFRTLAAQAATNQAEVITDPIRVLIRRLIPL